MANRTQWTIEQARAWGEGQRWRTGCNFYPSSAINQIEMWQAESFDPVTIKREMGWMQDVGMSVARIYLHDLAYEADPEGFKERMRLVLDIAASHGIVVLFTIFDDCWAAHSQLGKQPDPRPGMHNSGWLRSPSDDRRNWPADFARLKTYVQDVLRTFGDDPRVWMWDLYNEPGNSSYGEASLPLLKAVFEWAWEVRPDQPLTVAAFCGKEEELDPHSTAMSDVVTFHCYSDLEETKRQIDCYKALGRPLVCSEWMARTNDSRVVTHLPLFKAEGVSCVQWGFVSGKTGTIFPWGSKEGSPEPELWFHDLLRGDGSPYDPAEVETYRRLCKG
jgi:hypothetical protein